MSSITATEQQLQELVEAARAVEAERGIPADQLLSIFSFETAGTLDPWKAGPTTQWGQHRGLIQWGEPQARQYGVSRDSTIRDQVFAAADYLGDRGYRPGMRMENMYAAVLAGDANRTGVGDIHNGGVARSAAHATQTQFGPHTSAATSLLQRFPGSPRTLGPNPATDFNQQELAAIAPKTPAMPDAIRAARMPTLPATPSQLAKARIGNVQTPPTREAAMRSPGPSRHFSPQSSFPSRPSMGVGGLPSAPTGGLDTMRAQAQQTLQSTHRPQMGPFPVSASLGSAPQAKSPDQFQYSRPATPRQPAPAPRQARSPTQFQYSSAPAAPTVPAGPSMATMAQQYGMRALQDVDPFADLPAPTAPAPVTPSVTNPMAQPQSIAPPMQLAPPALAGKVPTFSSQAAAQMAAQIRSGKLNGAPQRGIIEQAFEGFNDWAGGMVDRIQDAPQRAAKQFGAVAAPTFQTVNQALNTFSGNAPNAPAPAPWEVYTGAGGGWAYGGTDQPYTSNAYSSSSRGKK